VESKFDSVNNVDTVVVRPSVRPSASDAEDRV